MPDLTTITITHLADLTPLGEPDVLRVGAVMAGVFEPDGRTLRPLEARGWVSALTNAFDGPDQRPADYDPDTGNRFPTAQPRHLTPNEVLAYARGLILDQNPSATVPDPREPASLNAILGLG